MITPRRITRLSLVLSFTVALSPHVWGQQPDGTRRYEDPSGLFNITIPEGWEVIGTENAATGITTRFRSPDEASLLSIVGGGRALEVAPRREGGRPYRGSQPVVLRRLQQGTRG